MAAATGCCANDGGTFTDVRSRGGPADGTGWRHVRSRPAAMRSISTRTAAVDILFGSRLMLNNGNGTFTDGSAAAGLHGRGPIAGCAWRTSTSTATWTSLRRAST